MNKEQAKNLIIQTFENTFDKTKFTNFITNILKGYDRTKMLEPRSGIQGLTQKYLDFLSSWERIGRYEDRNGNIIDILIINLKKEVSLYRARTAQRNFVAEYLQGKLGTTTGKDAALCAFISPDSEDWRFSLVKMDYRFEETPTGKVKVKEEFTPAKRWSFLVGKNEKSHTAQSRFVPILENDDLRPTLEDLENAFNVEVVTKEFFQKYRDLFIKTKLEIDRILQKDKRVKGEFENKNINSVDFAKKLLGQIVFLYFLQKKGWFGVEKGKSWGTGPRDFMRRLFNKEFDKYQNFYNDILEPLFYEALRTDRSSADHYYSGFNCKIPFLNGGLFDPINNFDWVNIDVLLPNELFSNTNKTKEGDIGDGILDVFDRYNFTVNEEEPLEKEVALDPELLGKIYEKLNAIRHDNFDEYVEVLKSGKKGEETKFNKEYGVYYTPREIVHYMCQESLINYLETELQGKVSRDDLEKFVKIADSVQENEEVIEKKGKETKTYKYKLPESIRNNAKIIDDKLKDIKVCDPAVGSGAFPIGMMHEIVRLRQMLSIYCNTGIPACGDIKITRRNLPHWTKEGSIYWVTFRLADSLPQEKLEIWKNDRERWLKNHPQPWKEKDWQEYNELFGERFENWLDAGYGSRILFLPEIREKVKACIMKYDGNRFMIHAVVIMPNHVHLLIEPFKGYSLSEILKGLKGASAYEVNKTLGTPGKKLWMEESYDHIVRSEKEYFHFIRYIKENPIRANLKEDEYWLYVTQAFLPVNTQTGMSVLHSTHNTQTGMSVLLYDLKRHCIENSLYGVDIDPGAVEICKLRFWLSLIVDEDDFSNIKPLPNLDYKVVCGDSLLGVEKNLFNQEAFRKLEGLKIQYFNETNPLKKQQLKEQIDKLIYEITNGHKEFDFEVYFSEVFHQKGGFDVVIANPPYIKEYVNRKAFDKIRGHPYYQGKMDIWYFFACKGIDLLKENGILTFIAQNNWVTSYGASKMRDKVIKDSVILQLVDFGPYFVFENSDIQTMIMIFKKDNKSDNYSCDVRRLTKKDANFEDVMKILNKLKDEGIEYLTPLVKRDEFIGGKQIVFSNLNVEKLLQKIASKGGFRLKENEISQGIVAPQDLLNQRNAEKLGNKFPVGSGIFVISEEEKQKLNLTPKELEIIKPYYTTKELKRYYGNKKNEFWIIYTKSDINKKIHQYPNIKRHLDKFKSIITSDFGPYGLHRARDDNFFKGKKIISLRKCEKPTFTYTDFDCYVSQTFFIIKTNRINLKLLTGIQNSKVIAFWLYHRGKRQGNLYQVDKEPLLNLPIPSITPQNQSIANQIEFLVNQILSLTQSDDYLSNPQKRAKVEELEKEIDQLVYKLYNLTEEEIKIIEGELK